MRLARTPGWGEWIRVRRELVPSTAGRWGPELVYRRRCLKIRFYAFNECSSRVGAFYAPRPQRGHPWPGFPLDFLFLCPSGRTGSGGEAAGSASLHRSAVASARRFVRRPSVELDQFGLDELCDLAPRALRVRKLEGIASSMPAARSAARLHRAAKRRHGRDEARPSISAQNLRGCGPCV